MVTMEGLTKVMFEQRPEGDEGGNPCINLGKNILGRGNSKCKGPEEEWWGSSEEPVCLEQSGLNLSVLEGFSSSGHHFRGHPRLTVAFQFIQTKFTIKISKKDTLKK